MHRNAISMTSFFSWRGRGEPTIRHREEAEQTASASSFGTVALSLMVERDRQVDFYIDRSNGHIPDIFGIASFLGRRSVIWDVDQKKAETMEEIEWGGFFTFLDIKQIGR